MSSAGSVIKFGGRDRLVLTITNGNTAAGVLLAPNLTAKVDSVAMAYEWYRFTKLDITVPPTVRFETTYPSTDNAHSAALAYYPETTASFGASLTCAGLLSLPDSIPLALSVVNTNTNAFAQSGVNCITGHTMDRKLRVKKKSLLETPTRWFRVFTSTEDAFITQGTILVAVDDSAGGNTVKFNLVVDYVVEFRGTVNTALIALGKSLPTEEEKFVTIKGPSIVGDTSAPNKGTAGPTVVQFKPP